jgi:type II secretion system protein G
MVTGTSQSMADEHNGIESQRGFTLLEMMVVVAIIAILAGILIPNFTRARAQAQTAACIGNMKTIATALELYYTDKESYPVATSASIDSAFMQNTMSGYLSILPHDPAAQPNTFYMLTTVSAASNAGVAGYTIWCPGSHDPATLQNIAPGTTNAHIRYDNKTGFAAAATQGS